MATIDITNKQRQCTREDLEAIIPLWERYTVDDDDFMRDYISEEDSHEDYVEEYECVYCRRRFAAHSPIDRARAEAWQAALDHLNTRQAAA